nr:4'-phosphopantetheinyl transferase superfamily protein [Thalassococcus arenae]
MVHAVPRRIAEFAGGRQAARAALEGLGIDPRAIPMGPDRMPVWPQGVAASITHADRLCLAVAAWKSAIPILGVDLETAIPIPPQLVPEIASDADLDAYAPLPRGEAALRVFSAKEAAYKALYPEIREVAGFDAITLRRSGTALLAEPARAGPWHHHPAARALVIRQWWRGGHLLSLALPAA